MKYRYQFQRVFVTMVMMLVIAAGVLIAESSQAQRNDSLRFKEGTRNLGKVFKFTGPVGYFDVADSGTIPIHIDTVYITPQTPGDTTFRLNDTNLHFWRVPVILDTGKFFRIGVDVRINDEAIHITTVTIVYNGGLDSIVGTLSCEGIGVRIHTTMEDREAHAFETFSIPIIADTVTPDSVAFIQRFTNVLTYNDELLKLDTAALTVGVDSQGVSRGFKFVIDSPFTAGHVIIHAIGPTNGINHGASNGHGGDTIYKLTFQAQQFLFVAHTFIANHFTGDIGFKYATFVDDSCNFTTLQCSSPAKVAQAATAQFVGTHPNPFNPSTRIRFRMDAEGFVELEVYDRLGRLVRTLLHSTYTEGVHEIVFDAEGLPSGTYVCRLSTGISVDQRLVTLSK